MNNIPPSDNSLLYWMIALFVLVLVFGMIAYPSSTLGRIRRKKKLKLLKRIKSLRSATTEMGTYLESDSVLAHIKKLTTKEDELDGKENLTDADINELHRVKLELDQYWDLLRQRRARSDAYKNSETAAMPDIDTNENYE
ncbi:DUF2630 family protein [Mucilaginibacter angelicae]|uniref:DUF2630 family protein n=1 Tax=Mucilaginibacter angelicae TaxID=869718 RepID=A0ABV6L2Z6_9SPHI